VKHAGGVRTPYVPLALAVLCVSSGAILVRYAQAPALAVAFHRVFLASVLLLPFAGRAAHGSWPSLTRPQRLALLGSGLALALHFATWIASLSFTSVAVSVLLVNTAPVFAIVLSRLALKESIPLVVQASIGVALIGASLIALGDWSGTPRSLTGAALALAGAVAMAVYHVIGRGLRAALPLNAYILGVWASSAFVLALLGLGVGTPLFDHPPRTYAALLALAVIPTLGGHGLVNRSLRFLPAPTVGLFLLGEPLGASILAYLLFGEAPGAWTLAGGAVVVAALAVVVLSARR